MNHYNYISNLVRRKDGLEINPKLFAFYEKFHGQKAIEFCTKCSPELLNKISEICQEFPESVDKVELWFGQKLPCGLTLYAKLPKGIDFSKDIPEISTPTSYLDTNLDIERNYIFLVYQAPENKEN